MEETGFGDGADLLDRPQDRRLNTGTVAAERRFALKKARTKKEAAGRESLPAGICIHLPIG
jgi:hypothetical protein